MSTDLCAFALAGIGYSDDKMLQTRIFSYADTQRYRLGPNYLMLPVNAPKNVHHNNHHDGVMNFMHRDEEVSRSCSCLQDFICMDLWHLWTDRFAGFVVWHITSAVAQRSATVCALFHRTVRNVCCADIFFVLFCSSIHASVLCR